jgi:hypothetical protein
VPIIGAPSVPAGGTAVPTDGTFANANWAEVFFTDHDYTGRTILTNGLLLADLSVGTSYVARTYLWSTGLSTAAWQKCFDLEYEDNAGNIGTLNSITARRIGQEESSVRAISSTSGGKASDVLLRLQRGRYEMRADFAPLVEASTTNLSLAMLMPATPKIIYNSDAVADVVLSETNPAVQTDYGYACAFIASTTYPFIVGFLYQNQPGGSMPYNAGNVATIGLGDTTSLATGPPPAWRSYGVFAIPYGVNGSYSTANLQAEAESGTLGTGWTSQANASASGGNEAKCASGTATTNADLWGTAFVPDPGTYDLWMRIKVTSAASATVQMQLGLWNSTDSTFVNSTTYAPNQFTTSYAWYKICSAVTPTATKSMRYRAVVAANPTNTDWFIDEAVLVPLTLTTDNRGPQQLYQQFAYDRGARMVRP